ncbi:MAG TPA: hypothetical protein VFE55_02435 [Acidimicrobiia bacterium]|nr:hypothetical protein [Acidimicrobiia bacterium]
MILFRTIGQRRACSQAALVRANLPKVAEDLEAGALVVVEEGRVRSLRLPLIPE